MLHHHEHWDGSGYPNGLAGEEIPLGSRVILVADAYDAMTSDRTLQDGQHATQALAEIRRRAGTQFDPAIVERARALRRARPRAGRHTPSRGGGLGLEMPI